MRLRKVSKEELEKLAIANTQIRNTIVVPFCIKGCEGVYVNHDDLIDKAHIYTAQNAALGTAKPEDISEVSDDVFDVIQAREAI